MSALFNQDVLFGMCLGVGLSIIIVGMAEIIFRRK